MKRLVLAIGVLALFAVVHSVLAKAPVNDTIDQATTPEPRDMDIQTWIDANSLLMFVTNKGSIGYDQGAALGKFDGLYYPFTGLENIISGADTRTVIFAGGVWIGGVDATTGDTLVSVSEYSDDYWPGPMVGGTYIQNADADSAYRVYKLYSDSMAGNPNQDYLNWPAGQGAPVDAWGNPKLRGLQTLWAVYNDANPFVHNNDASSNEGLGIEIKQLAWASKEPGSDTLPPPPFLELTQQGNSRTEVTVEAIYPGAMTGHDYAVEIDSLIPIGQVWHLIDLTTADTVLDNQLDFTGTLVEADGLGVTVLDPGGGFTSFEVVANGAGSLDPPEAGALGFKDFPTPPGSNGNGSPSDNQQLGAGRWAFHTADNGGSCGGGTRGSYDSFLSRVTRNGSNVIGPDDYEMRFTGSYDNPGVNGSMAFTALTDETLMWVPFELWRTGSDTPDDASDDVRLTIWIIDNIVDIGDGLYNLESWGCLNNAHAGSDEHSASGADNDPWTDWVYWRLPEDHSPGQGGYQADLAAMQAGTYDQGGEEIMARTVLINWNGGVAPPFNQDLPEQGTVFRLRTANQGMFDSFTFNASPPDIVTVGPDDLSIYVKYQLVNHGNRNLTNVYVSMWFDPDLGDAGDDLVGCDTLNDIFFCYNDGDDSVYGSRPPAVGGKLLEGPIVPSPGDTALVDGQSVPGYRNLPMYSFQMYVNGTDPQDYRQSYCYMTGLDWNCQPLPNGTRYAFPGDPPTGTGDLDQNSSDRRMMPSFGPFDMAPNDSQQVLIKLSVGLGGSAVQSVTRLRDILNSPPAAPPVSADAVIEPGSMYSAWETALDPPEVYLYTGDFSDAHSVLEVDPASLVINGTLFPTQWSIIPSHPDFSGEVLKITLDVSDFLLGYEPIWDSTVQSFSVAGQFTDGLLFFGTGSVTLQGHRSGDLNLDGNVDVDDLTGLVDFLFRGGQEPASLEAGDLDRNGNVDITDLSMLVDYLF